MGGRVAEAVRRDRLTLRLGFVGLSLFHVPTGRVQRNRGPGMQVGERTRHMRVMARPVRLVVLRGNWDYGYSADRQCLSWRLRQDSNPQHPSPEPGALSVELLSLKNEGGALSC